MNEVIVHPERCVGCMQCRLACATAHSQSGNLLTSVLEDPKPKPRIHVGKGLYDEGFPNRCRHCDPAPCIQACLAGAIFRDEKTNSVLIKPELCINCASCAMACPFGVIRYDKDSQAIPSRVIALKCDNCFTRQEKGLIPACVEACKTNALTFEESKDALKRKTDEVARLSSGPMGEKEKSLSFGFDLLMAHKKAAKNLKAEPLK